MTSKANIETFRQAIQDWGADNTVQSLTKVYHKDKIDLGQVLSACESGDLAQAYSLADMLDSVVRDVIPQAIYQDMETAKYGPLAELCNS